MLFRQLYEDELRFREHLRTATSLPVGLMALLGGALAYLARGVRVQNDFVSWGFLTALAAAVYYFLRTAYFLIRGYHGYTYQRIPSPAQLKRYRDELREYYVSIGEPPERAASEFAEFLDARYCEAAEKNTYANLAKSENLFRATSALVYCLILAALCVPFLILTLRS